MDGSGGGGKETSVGAQNHSSGHFGLTWIQLGERHAHVGYDGGHRGGDDG